jgi:hypothetical protein
LRQHDTVRAVEFHIFLIVLEPAQAVLHNFEIEQREQ